MSSQASVTPIPIGLITPGTLRAEMEARRASKRRFEIKEAIGIVVPLCTQLVELHAQGKTLFVGSTLGRGVSQPAIYALAMRTPGVP